MRRKFFIKNLSFFLILLLMPLVVMGIFSVRITKTYIWNDLNRDNDILVNQIKENLELVIEELEPLKLSYGIDGGSAYYTKKLLNSEQLGYIDINSLNVIRNNLSALTYARDYIYSIYIYFYNEGGYFLTDNGKEKLDSCSDPKWYDSYMSNKDTKEQWSERRVISMPGGAPQEVVSIYNILGTKNGVIVFNILPRYLEKVMKTGFENSDQYLLITNEDNEILFGNKELLNNDTELEDFRRNLNTPSLQTFEYSFSNQDNGIFIVQKNISSSYGWKYVLFSRKSVVYKPYYSLIIILAFIMGMTFFIGILISLYLAKKSTKQVYNIIDIIQAAEKNLPLPLMNPSITSTYGYIIQNIVKTFINQSYLKTQLEVRKYKLKSAQLIALQAQINPHFIFNTLETINWKVYQLTQSSNQANDMIEHLSDLLQYTLGSPESDVRLREEIEYLESYVYIQKIRYKDKFDLLWDYQQDEFDVKVPRLILQPLVENAIYHGIKPKQTKGLIKIKIQKKENNIQIRVIDNGLGMTAAKLEQVRKRLKADNSFESKNIGLSNINTRLLLKYQRGLYICSKRGWGTVIKLMIPIGGANDV